MTLKDRIKELCKKNGISMNKLEDELHFGKGYISKLGTSQPNVIKLQLIADRFGVSLDYLMTGKEDEQNEPKLNSKDEKDIQKHLDMFREKLMSQEGLMFDGDPASPEAIESILSAMQIGMEMAKKRNKEKYTPKKYRKKD
ncbi:MAG: helix-turn-helix transcriptional regulator [Ruminococcus sp.]|nr:helix-turn-helix transcriptional regulator [Ruminococcus sp.]